jgi:hypothetical protein
MASPRLPTLIAAALLLATPAIVAQEPQTPAPPVLDGTYDASTMELLLSWTPASGTPPGSQYTVLQDGTPVVVTGELHVRIDLSGWPQGLRVYEVNVTWPGGAGSSPSEAFRLAKDIELPSSCPVASVSIYTQPPGVQYEVYQDCIPG